MVICVPGAHTQPQKHTTLSHHTHSPVKCELINRKDEPKRVKHTPMPPLVRAMLPGLVEKLAFFTAAT